MEEERTADGGHREQTRKKCTAELCLVSHLASSPLGHSAPAPCCNSDLNWRAEVLCCSTSDSTYSTMVRSLESSQYLYKVFQSPVPRGSGIRSTRRHESKFRNPQAPGTSTRCQVQALECNTRRMRNRYQLQHSYIPTLSRELKKLPCGSRVAGRGFDIGNLEIAGCTVVAVLECMYRYAESFLFHDTTSMTSASYFTVLVYWSSHLNALSTIARYLQSSLPQMNTGARYGPPAFPCNVHVKF
jgi:hypothetical protein